MVFPPPGDDRRADATEQEETDCLREFSRYDTHLSDS
jgi:hypothetical protein